MWGFTLGQSNVLHTFRFANLVLKVLNSVLTQARSCWTPTAELWCMPVYQMVFR